MAPVSNRFAKYVVEPDENAGGGSAPVASKPNRFAKYTSQPTGPVNAPFVPERDNAPGMGAMIRKDYTGVIPEQPRYFKRPAPVMLPEEQAALDAEKAREAQRVKERKEAAGAYGAGQDFIITHGDDGQLRPSGPSDVVTYDLGKGAVGLPIQGLEAVKDAGVSLVNLASETYNTVNNAITAPLGVRPAQVPKITTPDNPLIAEGGALQSVTGDLARNLMQFLISRNIVGKMAPGGGIGADIAKDAIALGAGFDADTPRLSETVNEFVQKSGSPQVAKDYIGWLAQRDPSNPLLERVKNMIEDMTISGPLVAPQAVVRGAQAVGNALEPLARTPTNAGGAGVRAALDDPYRIPGAEPAPVGPQSQQGPATAQAPITAVPVTRQANQPPANALATPAPQQAAGQAIPPPSNAVDEFNALPMKTRESLIRAMTESGMSRPQINAAIQSLGNIPPGRNSMFATELLRKFGGQFPNLETNLTAMGRKWANETPGRQQVFGGRDSAREAMDNEIRTQINSEGRAITDVAERNFGSGVVQADAALESELNVLSGEYEKLLSTKRKPTGRLRNQDKKDAVMAAREDLSNYLRDPALMRTIPGWVKKQIMLQASDDMRRLKFTPEEMQTVLAGDGAVLAPLFSPNAPLEWSSALWEHLSRQYPTQAAHSLQSAYRMAADTAKANGDRTTMQMLHRLRGGDGADGVLDRLERAIPEYRKTRLKYGDAKSAQRAIQLLDDFKRAVSNEGDVADIIRGLKDLPERHREMAENQVTSLIRQELSRKIDSAKLSQLDDAARDRTPNLSVISRDDFLKALEDVFGERGRELADAIRLSRSMTDTLTGIHPKYNSRSVVNNEDVKNAGEIYEHPASKNVNVFDQSAQMVGGVGLGAAVVPGGQGPAIAMLGYAGLKSLYNAWKKGKRLTNAEKTALVDFLFRSRDGSAPARGGNGPPTGRPPRGPSGLGYGANALAGAGVGGGIGYASSGGDAETTTKGALVGAGFGAGRAVQRARRNANSLIKLPNALASPSPPPVRNGSGPINKAGFGGSSLDMSEPARMQRARELINERLNVSNAREVQPIDDAALLAASEGLSDSEFQMWKAAREGMSNQQIADLLSDAERTVTSNNVTVTLRHAKAKGFDVGSSAGTKPNSPDLVRALELRLTGLSTGQIAARVFPDRDPVKAANLVKHWLSKHRDLLDEVRKDPSQSGSSKLLAGMGGRVGSQVAPPAFAATVASVGPEGEAPEDKWARMAAAAALTVGVRNLPALRNFASKARGAGGANQATFGGINAKTADLKLKGIAEQMEKAGAGRDQIWKETGWFKGNDGKWRFEIPDNDLQVRPEAVLRGKGVLNDFVSDADAGGSYPELANIPTRRGEGYYQPPEQFADEEISFSGRGQNARSVIAHERQHAIQDMEGFATGESNSPTKFAFDAPYQAKWDAIVKEKREIMNAVDIGDLRKRQAKGERISPNELPYLERFNELEAQQQPMMRDLLLSPEDTYRRSAGEVEARNVQKRLDMTPEERRRTPPWVTQDTPDDKQVISIQRGGGRKSAPPAQAGFSFGGGGKRPPNALKDPGMPGPISPRVLEDATKAAGRLSPEVRNKLRGNAFSDDPAPAMQASGFDPNLFSFAQDARTPPPGKVQNAFARLTGQPTASPLERGLQKSIESVAGQRGRSALRVGNEDVPDLPFGMRMAMGERNATRKEQALARRAYTRAEKADKLDADKVKRVVVAEREARVAQEILDQARLDAFSAEDVGAIVREQMDAIAKAMNREPPSTLGLPTKGQRVSDALDDVVFGAPPKGARARPKAKDATYSASEADDAAKLLFSKEYARVWDDIVSGRTPVESIKPGSKEHLVLTVAAVGGIGALGVTSAILADRSGPMQEPHYPKPEDPRVHFDWPKQRTNRRFVENLQTRFNQIDRRYQLREDGIWSEGGDTDKVIRFWQDTNGFAPDGNLTEDQVALIEEQAIEALRAEPVGGRSGQPKRPAPRNALAPAQ